MEVTIRPGKYPTDWRMEFNSNEWTPAARAVLRGAESQACDLLSDLLSRTDGNSETADDILLKLNDRLSEVQSRLDDDGAFARIPASGRIETYGDSLNLAGDILTASFYLLSSGLESLRNDDIEKAVRVFQLSASFHARHCFLWDLLAAELDAPPSGPAHALASRPDQVLKPEWQAHCRAIQKSGNEVNRLGDLLNASGYPAAVTKIAAPTLRKWARECGINFKAGRPAES